MATEWLLREYVFMGQKMKNMNDFKHESVQEAVSEDPLFFSEQFSA